MQRGEVWLVNLDPALGSEFRKTRPVVIVSSDLLGVLPVHSCLTADLLKEYRTVAGECVRMMGR